MDREVIATLKGAGLDVDFREHVPQLMIRMGPGGEVQPLEDEVMVTQGDCDALVRLKLKRLGELYAGTTYPPSFAQGPTEDYVHFFLLIERTAAEYCLTTGERTTDEEFQRLYEHLRRRPDGTDPNPLYSYLQAGARFYLSLRDASRHEFEGVVRRLRRSAKTFEMGSSSTNYLDVALAHIAGLPQHPQRSWLSRLTGVR